MVRSSRQSVEVLCHEWAHALAWNCTLDRLSKMRGLDPVEFERACHDEAWGCAYSRVPEVAESEATLEAQPPSRR